MPKDFSFDRHQEDPDRDLPLGARRLGKLEKKLVEISRELRKQHKRHGIYVNDHEHTNLFGSIYAVYSCSSNLSEIDGADDEKRTRIIIQTLFNNELHPVVAGRDWFRGIAVPCTEGMLLIYVPWITDEVDRIAYLAGNPVLDEVSEAIGIYTRNLHELIRSEVKQRETLD